MSLGELVVQLGVKADTFTVRDFSKAIGDIPFSVASALTSLAGLSVGFSTMTKEVLDMTSGFRVFTAETGMNTKSLQQWQQVAKQAGIQGDIITPALTNLTSLMAQMRLGHGIPASAAQAFGMLGFKPNDFSLNAPDMLNKIQSGVSGKNPAMATELLKALGIDPQMMLAFQTPRAVREAMSPMMNQGDINQMGDFQKELATFNQAVMKEFIKALVDIEPYLGQLTEALTGLIGILGKSASGTLGLMKDLNEDSKAGRSWFFPDATAALDRKMDKIFHIDSRRNTFNVYGTGDPEETAQAVARHVTKASNAKAASDLQNRGF